MLKRGNPKPYINMDHKKEKFEEENKKRHPHFHHDLDHPPVPPREDLEGLLMHTGHLLRHRGHHFGASQDEVLDFLNENEIVSQKVIGGYLRIKPGTLSELLEKLEEKELIIRKKSEEDRRFSSVSLSEKGREYLKNKKGKSADKLAILSDEEKENLKNLLIKIIDDLEAKKED